MTTPLLDVVSPAADAWSDDGTTPIAFWAGGFEQPPQLTVSQWADEKRILPESSGARGALWRTDLVPYLRGIMDAVHEPGVQTVAVTKAAQVGGSEALHNIIGYFIEHDPCPILFVHPSAEVAEEWSKERLADMIRATPALRNVIRDGRPIRGKHEGESTLRLKMFPGGYLAIGGANTPNTFARRAVRIAIGDDVDRFPPVVGEEGDPADLLENRTRTFDDPLILFVSTPTMKGGRIDTLYRRSDQRRYYVTCPVCGREDWITWSGPCDNAKCGITHMHVSFEGNDPYSARLVCPGGDHGGCGSFFDEAERRAMVMGGEWRPTAEAQQMGLVGFHLPAMISTLGVTLPALVDKWKGAREKGKKSLQVFVNTTLAEGWEDRGARMEPNQLSRRREDYGEGIEIPAFAAALTAGVDVQDDRFELQVIAWGSAGESAVVDWREIPGDPKKPETRVSLLEALQRKYRHALGLDLPIHATCIDSGFATEDVYDFVLANQVRRIFATKGVPGRAGEPIVVSSSEKRRGQRARPVKLWLVNTDDAKSDVFSGLEKIAAGPGYMHFPLNVDRIDDEYFAQLCAEHKETRYSKSGVKTHTVWVQDRPRNEALDTAVLCLAAYKLLNPNIRQMHEAIVAASTLATKPTPPSSGGALPPAPATAPRPAAGRRVARSGYLGR